MGTQTAEAESTRERALLEAARGGEEAAFAALVEPWRSRLHAHCYRMLGSLHDADDALQDTLLRAWRAIGRFEGRSSLRGWLYRIATNVCLTAIERRPRRVLPLDHGPAADPHDPSGCEPLVETAWVEPYPDTGPDAVLEQRESVELAFVAALQHLPPNERATLLLREVLGFSAREVAEAMGTTTAAVNSAMQRARRLVDERLPEPSQQETLAALDDAKLQAVIERYTTALEEGDMDALLAMLTEDATWSMPPLAAWFRGREAIAGFLETGPSTVRWRHRVTRANGQIAIGCYGWDEDRGVYAFEVLDVLRLRGDRVAEVVAFIDRDLAGRFGLPTELPA
jgi:RNA polymerase sigma-70 factor, ECF subfamily